MAVTKSRKALTPAAKNSGRSSFENPKWTTACPEWEHRIVQRLPLTPCPPIFPDEADEAIETYNALQMCDQGTRGDYPTFGQLSLPWTTDFVKAVFGCYCDIPGHPLRGRRLVKTFFMLISKKNGKSTLAAGVMLTALLQNWRDEAEFIILSPTKEIADNSFKPIAAAIDADDELRALLHVQSHIRCITHRDTNATLKVVAADTQTVSGKKAVGILVDELHEFGKMPKAGQMLTEATGGLMSRPEGFVIYLTTQSSEPPAGVFKEKLEYARKVRDGLLVDPTFYPIIYEHPELVIKQKRYLSPDTFYMTNPNLGASVDEPTLLGVIEEARNTSEEKLLDVLAKHLNVEIGLNLRADRWPGADLWQGAAKLPNVSLTYLTKHCEIVAGGVDGGGLDDLLGAAMIGREKNWTEVVIPAHHDDDTGELVPEERVMVQRWVAWMRAWMHPSVLQRRQDIASKLIDLKNAGLVHLVKYAGQDCEQMAACFARINKAGLLFQIGFDPAAIGALIDSLLQAGVEAEKMVKVNQGYKLAGSIKTVERKIWEGVLVHDGNELGNWVVGNAKVVVRGNGTYVTKQVSGTAKIDPLIALFNAADIMQLNPEAQDESFDVSKMVIAG